MLVAFYSKSNKELREHQRDHFVQRYCTGQCYKTIPKALVLPWSTEKTEVKKKNSTTVNNSMLCQDVQEVPPKLMRRQKDNCPGKLPKAYSDIKGVAALYGTYICIPASDNYLLYSSSVWDIGQGDKMQVFSDERKKAHLNFTKTSIQSPKTTSKK